MFWWILRRLRSRTDQRQEEAVALPTQYQDARVIPTLIEVCFDDWSAASVREAAANALLRIDDPKVVELLVTSLVNKSFYLDKLPRPAYQTIIRDKRGVSLLASELRRKWTVESGHMTGPDIRLITALMEDELVTAIGYPLVTHLGEMLRNDPHSGVRRFAAVAMTYFLPSYLHRARSMLVDIVVEHLAQALRDPDDRVSGAAETGLLHHHTPFAVSTLSFELRTKRGEHLKGAVENLNRAEQSWINSEAAGVVLPALVQALREQEAADLELAITALDMINPAWVRLSEAQAVAPHLRAQMDSERRQFGRRSVIGSLVRIQHPNGIGVLIEILDPSRRIMFSDDFWARRLGSEAHTRKEDFCAAVQALNESDASWVKSPRAGEVVKGTIAAIEENGEYSGESFEAAAFEVLGAIGDKRAVRVLLDRLDDEEDSLPPSYMSGGYRLARPRRRASSRAAAARSLGQIGAVEAVPYLVKALNVVDGVQEAAAHALRQIGWPKADGAPDAICSIAKGDFKNRALAQGLDWLPDAVSTERAELYLRCLAAERLRGIDRRRGSSADIRPLRSISGPAGEGRLVGNWSIPQREITRPLHRCSHFSGANCIGPRSAD